MRPVIVSLAFVFAGCIATDEGSDPTSGDDIDDPDPSTDPDPVGPPVATGTYRVRSTIDLTVNAVLPETAANLVATLRDFSQRPAHTLLDAAEAANVPAVQEIRDALPSYVEDKLEGWIDGEIAKLTIDGTPITAVASEIAALAETSLTRFALESELVVGATSSQHRLTALDLAPAGIGARYELSPLPDDIVLAAPACASNGGALAIGDHRFGIPYGEYVWDAVNARMIARFGLDARGVLGAAIDCRALSTTIANKCYWDYCVGHQPQLEEICERGLDEIVERAHDKVAAMRFDALHFAAGSATIVDTSSDGVGDRLANGVWTAEVDVGMGLRRVPATFEAMR